MIPSRNRTSVISITTLLAATVGALVTLTVGVVIGLSFYANFTNTTELLEQSSAQLIKRIEEHMQDKIDPARFVVGHISRQAELGLLDVADRNEMRITLRASMAAAPELTGVAFWQPDMREMQVRRQPGGRLVILSESNVGNKPLASFLDKIRLAKKPVWSGPLRFNGLSFVSVSSAVFRDGEYLGTVSAGISIANLSFAIKKAVEGTDFNAFILYGDDKVLAHKNLPQLSKARLTQDNPLHSIENVNDPVLAAYGSGKKGDVLTSDLFDVRIVKLDATRHVVITHDILLYGDKKWRVGVHVPQSEVMTQIRRVMLSFGGGLALMIISVLATIFLARKVAKPIKSLSVAATRIGKLDLDKIDKIPPSRIREINNQSKAFNQMLDGLQWFESYVPRKLVGRLVKSDNKTVTQSRQEVLTVMFTDLIGFTRMSEPLPPAETAAMLNQHFELINACIEETDGTLDKYIGDAVMAFWGAPEAQTDHAVRACDAALQIADKLAQENHNLRMKIALHTGPLIVGNIGAKARMNYTVIGDTVNTCSRIESLAGELDDGSRAITLVSRQVVEHAGDVFIFDPVGAFSVKGRNEQVEVFRLKGRK